MLAGAPSVCRGWRPQKASCLCRGVAFDLHELSPASLAGLDLTRLAWIRRVSFSWRRNWTTVYSSVIFVFAWPAICDVSMLLPVHGPRRSFEGCAHRRPTGQRANTRFACAPRLQSQGTPEVRVRCAP